MCRTLLTLFLLLLATPAWSATYFVTTGGSGSACSSGSPCGSIAQAISNSSSGDTINIGSGTYNENHILPKGGTTLQGTSGATWTMRPTGGSNDPCVEITSGNNNV